MKTKQTGRNHVAVVAQFRQGGSMKDKRTARGGASNDMRDFLAECEEDDLIAEEVSLVGESEHPAGYCSMCDGPCMIDTSDDMYDWDFDDILCQEECCRPVYDV